MKRRRNFEDKVVIITGAAGGIGSALARRFGVGGARVGLLDLDHKGLSALERELSASGVACRSAAVDITDEKACRKSMEEIVSHYQGIDVLINNAGIAQRSAFTQTTADVYRRIMSVNFFGALFCTQAAIDNLRKRQGMIIVMSSVAGFAPLLGRSGYAASKYALHGLFETMRTELRSSGVDVMMVCPSFVGTDFRNRALDGDGSITSHPQSTVGRIITADRVADRIFKAAAKCRRLLVLSPAGIAALWMSRLNPKLYEYFMARSLRSELQR